MGSVVVSSGSATVNGQIIPRGMGCWEAVGAQEAAQATRKSMGWALCDDGMGAVPVAGQASLIKPLTADSEQQRHVSCVSCDGRN